MTILKSYNRITRYMVTSSDYIQIITAGIYAVALFYTIVTFRRAKRLDQITSLDGIMTELRDLDRELAKIPSGNGMLFVPTGVSHGPIGSLVAFGK
jgi:hypothetical protein